MASAKLTWMSPACCRLLSSQCSQVNGPFQTAAPGQLALSPWVSCDFQEPAAPAHHKHELRLFQCLSSAGQAQFLGTTPCQLQLCPCLSQFFEVFCPLFSFGGGPCSSLWKDFTAPSCSIAAKSLNENPAPNHWKVSPLPALLMRSLQLQQPGKLRQTFALGEPGPSSVPGPF